MQINRQDISTVRRKASELQLLDLVEWVTLYRSPSDNTWLFVHYEAVYDFGLFPCTSQHGLFSYNT